MYARRRSAALIEGTRGRGFFGVRLASDGYFAAAPFALRRAAQYFFILADTALRAAADIPRRRRRGSAPSEDD